MARKRIFRRVIDLLLVGMILITAVWFCWDSAAQERQPAADVHFTQSQEETGAEAVIETFAKEHGLRTDAWPKELVELLHKNPETQEFVLRYPLERNLSVKIDLREQAHSDTVPLLMQWDRRWGYRQYAGELLGLSGCGPTCLSMVCIYLTKDGTYSPAYVAEFAERKGYAVKQKGSSWELMSKGAQTLGLDAAEIPLDKNRVIRNLEAGNPVICVMGPGDFTATGHFIVLTGYQNGAFTVNDPNSRERSQKLWQWEQIASQIRNLWAYRKK